MKMFIGNLHFMLKRGNRLVKMIFVLGSVTSLSFPGLLFFLLLAKPCTLPYLGSMVLEENKCGTGLNLSLKSVTLALFDTWMWSHVAGPATLFIGNVFFNMGTCFLEYVKHLGRQVIVEVLYKFVCKLFMYFGLTGSIQGTTRIWANYENSQASGMKDYRSLQILENRFNACFKNLFLPGILGSVSALFIFSLFVSIKFAQLVPLPGFLFFPLALFDCGVIILVEFSTAGFLHERSASLVEIYKTQSMVGHGNNKVKKVTKMTAQSLAPLKIRMGMNYVDKFTPLVILNFCVSESVSLIMIA